ncbi:MAG: 50S ribosomal protein L21 [Elusimicrobiota bacterium]|jgi:large subunit ribosomal protein L21
MYAIIETGGKQYWVVPGDTLRVEKLEAETGSELVFKALWANSEEQGTGKSGARQTAKVTAQVVRQVRSPKVIVFKKRPKKNYVRRMGHRQDMTEIRIKDVSFN